MTSGERIRQRRKELKLSQKALGVKVGVEGQAVSQWETGSTKNLRGENLVKLAKALGVSPDYITHGTTDSARPMEGVAEQDAPEYRISGLEQRILAIIRPMSVSRKEALLRFLSPEPDPPPRQKEKAG